MAKGERIEIHDINAAAFARFRGIYVESSRQDTGRVVFCVEATREAYEALAEFQTDPQVPLLAYLSHLRRLRSIMLDLRDNGERRNGHEQCTAGKGQLSGAGTSHAV